MAIKKILITGASGFLGSTLLGELSLLSAEENEIFSIGLTPPQNLSFKGFKHSSCNLEEEKSIEKAIETIQPDCVYHLAGLSQVSRSIPFEAYFRGNFILTRNLLKALAKIEKPIQFLLASSVHVYGNQSGPISEDCPLRPESAYAFTKFLAEESLRHFCKESPHRKGLAIRLYSCVGPGQSPGFVASDFAHKIKKSISENLPIIKTGPLNTYRQFLDTKDVAKAFCLLMGLKNLASFEIFNLASPQKVTTQELLDAFLTVSGAKVRVESSPSSENSFTGLEISNSKFLKVAPRFTFRPLNETVQEIWSHIQLSTS